MQSAACIILWCTGNKNLNKHKQGDPHPESFLGRSFPGGSVPGPVWQWASKHDGPHCISTCFNLVLFGSVRLLPGWLCGTASSFRRRTSWRLQAADLLLLPPGSGQPSARLRCFIPPRGVSAGTCPHLRNHNKARTGNLDRKQLRLTLPTTKKRPEKVLELVTVCLISFCLL